MKNNIILSIIIPSYKETEKEIFPLLSSINNQVNLDFSKIEIIIIRDGSELLNFSQLNNFLNFNIQQLQTFKNVGPGLTRQSGLDNSKGQYIMFCDADDILHNIGILDLMLSIIQEQNLDLITTHWLEEVFNPNTKKMVYLDKDFELAQLHGKIFKHDFLIKNNIQFHPDLRYHEDSYFMSIFAANNPLIKYLNITSYVWKFNTNSITRKNHGSFKFLDSEEFIKSHSLIFKYLKEQNHPILNIKLIRFIIYIYFLLHSKGWETLSSLQNQKIIEEKFLKCINLYLLDIKPLSLSEIFQIYNETAQNEEEEILTNENLLNWLNRLNLKIYYEQ